MRFRWRREPVDETAIRSDKILRETPLGFARKPDLLRRLSTEGMDSFTFDADFVRLGKVDVVVDLAERFYFLRRSRFLISEIIRRHAKHDKSVVPVAGLK